MLIFYCSFVIIAAMARERELMRLLDEAGELGDNEDPVRQFAIKEAKRLLRAAGVVDPGPKGSDSRNAKKLPGPDSFIPPQGEVLSPGFAERVRDVVLQLPPDLPLGSLRHWNKAKRRELINNAFRGRFADNLRQLPEAPGEWVAFMESLNPVEKQGVAMAFSRVMEIESGQRIDLKTPIEFVAEKLNSSDKKWGKSEHFVAAAFSGLAQS